MTARVLLLLFVSACGGSSACGATETSTTEPTRERVGGETTSMGTTAETPSTPPAPDPAPEPVLRIDTTQVRARGVQLRVQSRGTQSVQLRRAARVERREGEEWTPVETELSLRMDCQAPDGECLELAPGAEFLPPTWTGSGQCCEECDAVPSGTYRVVVSSCAPEGMVPHEVRSETFELP